MGELIRGRRWRKLVALINHLPPESATVAALHGPQWTRMEHLLASVVDVLQAANWQRQGRKGAPRPKPIRRPGVDRGEERYGGESMTPEEVDAVLASRYRTEEG